MQGATLGVQEQAMKTCSRQVKPPRNSTKKAVGRRVHTMPAHENSGRQTSLQV